MSGSDQTVNYQLRPAKSIERKMMCDLIRGIQVIRNDNNMRYIGMGAKYFVDFVLFHNEFGIEDMISIESEEELRDRYEYNKPLKCIEMRYGTTNKCLSEIDFPDDKMDLIWLDYDGLFDQTMLIDIGTICRNISIGSTFFITCNYSFKGQKRSEKIENFKENVGDFFDETIEGSEYTSNGIPMVIRKLVNNQIRKTLNIRNKANQTSVQYNQLMFMKYSDGAPMMTIGGILVNQELKKKITNSKLFEEHSFMSRDEKIFSIDIPKLTNKEIQLILQNLPITEEEFNERADDFHGIKYKEIDQFAKIYRYYPYYYEGSFNT